ncbi:unnamed protein product [Protopolystoma xenopodis]|uniref:Uncharacterized protein n=1 Tax=Protopolystoma xenopodis TaxID=117903 RepID=A0A3S5AN73_9PLAT|nr:unnamed protein product [Protopolystoma xenopodis]
MHFWCIKDGLRSGFQLGHARVTRPGGASVLGALVRRRVVDNNVSTCIHACIRFNLGSVRSKRELIESLIVERGSGADESGNSTPSKPSHRAPYCVWQRRNDAFGLLGLARTGHEPIMRQGGQVAKVLSPLNNQTWRYPFTRWGEQLFTFWPNGRPTFSQPQKFGITGIITADTHSCKILKLTLGQEDYSALSYYLYRLN